MADIAVAAEVGKGTLYRRFANKGELCYALMDEHLAEFQNTQIAEMRRMSAAGIPHLRQLAQFLGELALFTEEHEPFLSEVKQLAPQARVSQMPHFWQYMTVHGLLESAVRAGELPADLDNVFLADMLLASLSADFFRFLRQVRGFSAEQIGRGLRELVLRFGTMED
jgi:AcrR family transcriptional regulator